MNSPRPHLVSLVLVLLLLALPTTSGAAELACPRGNLLRGKTPVQSQGVIRAETLTDSRQPFAGAFWDTDYTAVFVSESSFVFYDLGGLTVVEGLQIEADNNDSFEISISSDGVHFEHLLTLPTAAQEGMQIRAIRAIGKRARFIRIGDPRGDGYFSIGEVQVYCQLPRQWPIPVPLVGDAPLRHPDAKAGGTELEQWWSDREIRLSVHKSVIGVLALAVFLGLMSKPLREARLGWLVAPAAAAAALAYAAYLTWGLWPLLLLIPLSAERLWRSYKQQGAANQAGQATSERGVLIAIILVGSLTWTNFLTFHGSREPHLWDFMHYYVGSKYFAENDFQWLYHCALLAELDDGRRDEVMKRRYRSLKDNRLGPARLIEQEARENCRANFSDPRWQAFQQDLRIFRDLMGASWFAEAFQDHGYNATPAWTSLGSLISNWGWKGEIPPLHKVNSPKNLEGKTKLESAEIQRRFIRDRDRLSAKIKWLARIDLALYAGIFAMISWAFGLRTGALAIAMWSVGHPWAYYWTGGSFGRTPWLFLSVLALCAMKKGHNKLAGAGIAWAILLRAFPAALAGGLALKFAWKAIRQRSFDPQHGQIIAGAVAATLLIGATSVLSTGFDAHPGFLANSVKHQSTPLTNHMGLRTLVAYEPSSVSRHLRTGGADPYKDWKQRRREVLADRILVFAALVLCAFALVGAVGRERPDWEITSISTLLLFGLFELTGYYFSYLVILAPFCVKKTRYAAAFMAAAIATQQSALWINEFDEMHVVDSAIILALLVYVIGSELRRKPALETG